MKKLTLSAVLLILLTFLFGFSAFAEDNETWKSKPVITSLYETAKEQFFLSWEGSANLYAIHVDGKEVDSVITNNATINIKAGIHQIAVIPMNNERRDISTYFEINVANFFGGSIDLGALGVDPKTLVYGTPSDLFRIDYTPDAFFDTKPSIIKDSFDTDFDDNVCFEFTDKYNSDIYRVIVQNGKDTTYADFNTSDPMTAAFISKDKSTVSIVLDQDILRSQGCMVPEMDKKYSFSVKLRKWPNNMVSGENDMSYISESKESSSVDFTPSPAWKHAPAVTYHSQTADGQITLKWEHEDNGLGCEYQIQELDKVFVVKKGKNVVGTTSDKEYVITDLMNGKHTFLVIPVNNGIEGQPSEEVTEEVKNDWVTAPSLAYEISGEQVRLNWPSAEGVNNYHITIYVGNGSLLRFVNLDYKKYSEIDIPAEANSTEYTFDVSEAAGDAGIRLKFEVYGVRYTANGSPQQSAVSTQTVIIQ